MEFLESLTSIELPLTVLFTFTELGIYIAVFSNLLLVPPRCLLVPSRRLAVD
jgi:hypothetical protein